MKYIPTRYFGDYKANKLFIFCSSFRNGFLVNTEWDGEILEYEYGEILEYGKEENNYYLKNVDSTFDIEIK